MTHIICDILYVTYTKWIHISGEHCWRWWGDCSKNYHKHNAFPCFIILDINSKLLKLPISLSGNFRKDQIINCQWRICRLKFRLWIQANSLKTLLENPSESLISQFLDSKTNTRTQKLSPTCTTCWKERLHEIRIKSSR